MTHQFTVLALIDNSPYAQSVCQYASFMAQKSQALIKLYHVLPPAPHLEKADLSGAIALGARSKLLEALVENDQERAKILHENGRILLEEAQAILSHNGVQNIETRLRRGTVLDTIIEKEERGDLIVIGKRGEQGSIDFLEIGSHIESILRHSHKPVFLANREFSPLKSALLAFDGSQLSQKAVDYLCESEIFAGMAVELAFIGNPKPEDNAALENAKTKLQNAGYQVKIRIEAGEAKSALPKICAEDAIDLLIIGAYSHSKLRAMILGSTTNAVIHSCSVPVLVMRD